MDYYDYFKKYTFMNKIIHLNTSETVSYTGGGVALKTAKRPNSLSNGEIAIGGFDEGASIMLQYTNPQADGATNPTTPYEFSPMKTYYTTSDIGENDWNQALEDLRGCVHGEISYPTVLQGLVDGRKRFAFIWPTSLYYNEGSGNYEGYSGDTLELKDGIILLNNSSIIDSGSTVTHCQWNNKTTIDFKNYSGATLYSINNVAQDSEVKSLEQQNIILKNTLEGLSGITHNLQELYTIVNGDRYVSGTIRNSDSNTNSKLYIQGVGNVDMHEYTGYTNGNYSSFIYMPPQSYNFAVDDEATFRTLKFKCVNTGSTAAAFMDASIDQLDLSEYDTSYVTDMHSMFLQTHINDLNLNNFKTVNVTDMSEMFNSSINLHVLDLSSFDTSNVTNMHAMFCNCNNLKVLNLGQHWYTSNVTKISNIFGECNALEVLNLGQNWDTSKVTDMQGVFQNCFSLETLDLQNWNTSKVTDMHNMFSGCYNLKVLNLGQNWDMKNVTDISNMFNCPNLTTITGKVSNIKRNLDLTQCPNLTRDSILVLINGLGPSTSEGNYVYLREEWNTILYESDLQEAFNKGWTFNGINFM